MPISTDSGNQYEVITVSVALSYLGNSPSAAYLLSLDYNVSVNYTGINVTTTTTRQIFWDPTTALQVVSAQGILGVQSPAMGLIHELVHAIFGLNEDQATAFETQIALELGEPTRANYEATLDTIKVENPTLHTENGQWVQRDSLNQVVRGPMYDGGKKAPAMGWVGPIGGGTGGGNGGNPGNSGSGPNPTSPPEKEPPTGTPVYPIPADPELPNEM